jgi:hypothetical protein
VLDIINLGPIRDNMGEKEDFAEILEKLMYYYVTTPFPELKSIFQAVIALFYKYFKLHEVDKILLKRVRDFIEMKKKEPIKGLEQ